MSAPADTDDELVASRTAAEERVRELLGKDDVRGAATVALETYGPELYGFLHALAREDDLAAEAFATFSEDLWKGLAKFRWESSLRTWSYALAKNALWRLRRDPRRRPEHNVELDSGVADVVAQVRTQTVPYLRTTVKDELSKLRDELDPDDHALLILRIDRRLSWRDIARALPGEGEVEVDKRAATLRKRFERAKSLLRDLATARGIIPKD
ncbi:MAG: sigma-70 family RNA polymerase sigma factor [Deltaproteobacteria bacterium]|nr:sigma-70 family RNA polymerase sigma factor [Deltaproteobacteria bacterium]